MTLPLYKRSKLRNAGEWYFLESIVIGPHENPREKIAGLKANRARCVFTRPRPIAVADTADGADANVAFHETARISPIPQVTLNRAGVLAITRQLVAARMAEHVAMRQETEALTGSRNHALISGLGSGGTDPATFRRSAAAPIGACQAQLGGWQQSPFFN